MPSDAARTTPTRFGGAVDGVMAALAFAVGLQLVRHLLTGAVFTLREVYELSTPAVGGLTLLVFASTFLAPGLVRLLGPRAALLACLAVMAAARLAEQFTASPTADLALAAVGAVAFLAVIPLSLSGAAGATGGGLGGATWRLGLLLGLALDTAVKGAFATLDPAWQSGIIANIVGAGLPLALLALTARAAIAPSPDAAPALDHAVDAAPLTTLRSALPLAAVGPFLFLELLLFQNLGQLTALTGWTQPAALTWLVAANGAGVHAARFAASRRVPLAVHFGVATALAATAGLLAPAIAGGSGGATIALAMAVGHVSAAFLLTAALSTPPAALAPSPSRPSQRRGGLGGVAQPPAVALSPQRGGLGGAWRGLLAGRGPWLAAPCWLAGAGSVLFLTLAFAYYAQYDIDLGVPRVALLLAAMVLVATPALSTPRGAPSPSSTPAPWAPAMAAALLLAPLALAVAWDPPAAPVAQGLPLRVMTYNIHQGFDTSGAPSLEAIARAIESESPDVVALQEVTRGWLVAGSVDTLVWLSHRLDMPYVWGPAADAVWGNAVLSRYPVRAAERHAMPNNGAIPMDRGFLWLELDTGDDDPLRVIATHFHSPPDEGAQRLPMSSAVLQRWANAERTVLLGDLNAQPHHPEIALLTDAGLIDAYAAAGPLTPPHTFPSDNLQERIDYIWTSPDLTPTNYSASLTQASDHLPVAATISAR